MGGFGSSPAADEARCGRRLHTRITGRLSGSYGGTNGHTSIASENAMTAADVPADGSVAAPAARTRAPATAWISWVALAMMTTSSVASLRAAPTMAVYGLACVFLYLLPAIVFLLPTSLRPAKLASGGKGGIYRGFAEARSKPMGCLAVWCQFAMTIFYYPSLLGFVPSTLAYVCTPEIPRSRVRTAAVIIVVNWAGLWV